MVNQYRVLYRMCMPVPPMNPVDLLLPHIGDGMGTVNPGYREPSAQPVAMWSTFHPAISTRTGSGCAARGSRSALESRTAEAKFDLKKGLGAATFSGVMSACFGYGLARGAPLKALTLMSSGNRTQLTYQDARAGQSHFFKRAVITTSGPLSIFLSPNAFPLAAS